MPMGIIPLRMLRSLRRQYPRLSYLAIFALFVFALTIANMQLLPQQSLWRGHSECPFSNIDILIHVHSSWDLLAMGSLLAQSIDRFVPCIKTVRYFMSKDEGQLPIHLILPQRHRTVVHYVDESPLEDVLHNFERSGWVKQQWSRMLADSYSDADYFLFMDTDTIFSYPLTCSSLFDDNGLPYFFYWDIGEIDFYRKVVEFALPQGFYHSCHVSFYPYVIPRTVFPPLRQTITEHLGKPDFNAAFKEIAVKLQTFSEFNLLGNYMLTMKVQGKNMYNSPVPCPFSGYVMADDGKKFEKCRNHAFPALHIPYPYSPNMNNLPGNVTSWGEVGKLNEREGYLGKFNTATERYMVEVSRAFNHGYCLAEKYKSKLNHFDKFSPLFAISNQVLCAPESSRFSNQSFAYQEGLIPGFKRDFDLMEKRIFRLDSQRSGRCDVPV